MLIDLARLLQKYQMVLKGVIHGGAHECEEMAYYKNAGLTEKEVIWFEANPFLVEKMSRINNALQIFPYALYHESGKELNFNVTNNFQSSSILPLKTHAKHYPNIVVKEKIKVKTIRIDDFFMNTGLTSQKIEDFNFLNLDIQGAELSAIRGMGDLVQKMEMLYIEVNKEELYEGCCVVTELDEYLWEKGFIRLDTEWTAQNWGDAFYLRKDFYKQHLKNIQK